MTTFADSLKREIARVARKELRDEIAALRKNVAVQRSEISGLKKHLHALQAQVRKLDKVHAAKGSVERPTAEVAPGAEPKGRPGRKAVFTAERLKAQRVRLGLTQEQMGKLLGVSSLSIWKWESGSAEPRASRIPAILQKLALGKREVLAIVESAGS